MPRTYANVTWTNDRGTAAVEYALVAPVFIVLIVSAFYFCMAVYTIASLHYAVQEGARCASVKTLVCTDSSTTLSYTKNNYFGPDLTPAFSYSPNLSCGKSVSASVDFIANLGLHTVTIPLTASACFP
jgi:Flp pilus assembly protein TadG